MSLLAEERKKTILDECNQFGKVKVVNLARRFQVSEETIRRDLDLLERQGKLKRVYGGAVRKSYDDGEPPYQMRQGLHSMAKQAIGQAAAQLLKDGDTVVIDTGTTMLELAKAIQRRKRLTIITNSLPVAAVLTESLNQQRFSGSVIMLGGEVNAQQQAISGSYSARMLEPFAVDKAFISIGGISLLGGISDYDLNESLLSRVMIKIAKEVIVLSDHSKIGVRAFCQIASLDAVDMVICDQPYPTSWRGELEAKGTHWIVAEPGGGQS